VKILLFDTFSTKVQIKCDMLNKVYTFYNCQYANANVDVLKNP